MRANDDVRLSGFEGCQGFLLLRRRAEPAQHFDACWKSREAPLEGLEVLKGEYRGGRKNGDLLGVGDSFERGTHGYFGFAVPDVAAQQTIHRRGAFHVALDVGDGEILIGSLFEFEGVFKFALEVAARRKCQAGRGFSGCVQRQELFRHVFQGFADARLARIPPGAAEFVERRMSALDDTIALHQVHALERNVQARVLGVPQQHEFAAASVRLDLAETLELADTVVHVDDKVARLEFGEIAEEAGGANLAAGAVQRRRDLEEVRIPKQREFRFWERYSVGEGRAD